MGFLELPPELRILVYTYLFKGKTVNPDEHYHSLQYPNINAISFTCRKTYYESIPLFYNIVTFSFTRLAWEYTSSNFLRQVSRKHKIKIPPEAILKLGYNPNTGKWRRTPEAMSIEHITVQHALILCGCGEEDDLYYKFGLERGTLSNGEILNQLILAARSADISLSVAVYFSEECYKTTTAIEISPAFDFRITRRSDSSNYIWIQEYCKDLQGYSEESINQAIEHLEKKLLDTIDHELDPAVDSEVDSEVEPEA